jgi:hypothetical protein
MKTLLALLIAAFLALSTSAIAAAQASRSTVKLKVVAGVPVVDGVYFHGKGPFRFLLDTGNQSDQIEIGLARKLAIAPSFEVELYTPAGPSRVSAARVDQVALGSSEVNGQEFLLTKLEGVHALSPDIQGILGQQFLSRFDYTLDFQHHELTLGEEAPVEGDQIPVRLSYGRMVVSTSEGGLVLDSGTDTLFLYRASPRPANAMTMGSSGLKAAASMQILRELRIGKRVYHPSNAVCRPVPEAPEAGLLPASLFHAVFVSNSAGYVVFDPARRSKGGSSAHVAVRCGGVMHTCSSWKLLSFAALLEIG